MSGGLVQSSPKTPGPQLRSLRAVRVPSAYGGGSEVVLAQRPKLIASDVDGTLLNSQQQLTPRVLEAVRQADRLGVPLVLATGKARGPWVGDVLPHLDSALPGVYLQGLLICESDGTVIYSRSLERDIILDCIRLAKDHGVTLTAYTHDRIICEATDKHTDRLIFYREPTPEAVGPLEELRELDVQKLIFLAPHDSILELRPLAEHLLQDRASLTTALRGMLEVLPLGASKGHGLGMVLDRLGVAAQDVLALGDGENDLEMLSMAGVSVAMDNAGARVKEVADFTTASNDEDGVALAIEKYVLAGTEAGIESAAHS